MFVLGRGGGEIVSCLKFRLVFCLFPSVEFLCGIPMLLEGVHPRPPPVFLMYPSLLLLWCVLLKIFDASKRRVPGGRWIGRVSVQQLLCATVYGKYLGCQGIEQIVRGCCHYIFSSVSAAVVVMLLWQKVLRFSCRNSAVVVARFRRAGFCSSMFQ